MTALNASFGLPETRLDLGTGSSPSIHMQYARHELQTVLDAVIDLGKKGVLLGEQLSRSSIAAPNALSRRFASVISRLTPIKRPVASRWSRTSSPCDESHRAGSSGKHHTVY